MTDERKDKISLMRVNPKPCSSILIFCHSLFLIIFSDFYNISVCVNLTNFPLIDYFPCFVPSLARAEAVLVKSDK